MPDLKHIIFLTYESASESQGFRRLVLLLTAVGRRALRRRRRKCSSMRWCKGGIGCASRLLVDAAASSASTLTAPLPPVIENWRVDCEKVEKGEAEKVVQKLIEAKEHVNICAKDNSPVSIQAEEVVLAANVFAIKKSLAKLGKEERDILTRWIKVFANKTSLGLSFRQTSKGFSPEFLYSSPDFDYAAIGTLSCLCNKCEEFSQELMKAIVF